MAGERPEPKYGRPNAQTRQNLLAYFRYELATLCLEAEKCGIVLTVENVPQQPLAMGNHAMVPAARLARERS